MKAHERDPAKRPAAVVLLTRGPLVLALTRGSNIADLHFPGGKEEDEDGHRTSPERSLMFTAGRELFEETGILAEIEGMTMLVDFVSHTGRPIRAFHVKPQDGRQWPKRFELTSAGYPGWVEPAAVLAPWCTYRKECAEILRAASEGNEQLAAVLVSEHLKGTI